MSLNWDTFNLALWVNRRVSPFSWASQPAINSKSNSATLFPGKHMQIKNRETGKSYLIVGRGWFDRSRDNQTHVGARLSQNRRDLFAPHPPQIDIPDLQYMVPALQSIILKFATQTVRRLIRKLIIKLTVRSRSHCVTAFLFRFCILLPPPPPPLFSWKPFRRIENTISANLHPRVPANPFDSRLLH